MTVDTENHQYSIDSVLVKEICEKIVYYVLIDNQRSPFLKQIHSEKSSENVISSSANVLIRCIQVIVSCSNDKMATRNFLGLCFSKSPLLYSRYLRVIQVPEPIQSFATIATFSLVTFLIEDGPEIWKCMDNTNVLSADKVISNVMPKCLTKNILTKTLQSSNALLIVECSKTIGAILSKLLLLKTTLTSENTSLVEECNRIALKRLPDLQVFLSVRAKFDPFDHEDIGKVAIVVTIGICDLIKQYTSLFLRTLSTLQFDWIKLLPDDATKFCTSSLTLQSCLLSTLSGILNSYQVSKFDPKIMPFH